MFFWEGWTLGGELGERATFPGVGCFPSLKSRQERPSLPYIIPTHRRAPSKRSTIALATFTFLQSDYSIKAPVMPIMQSALLLS